MSGKFEKMLKRNLKGKLAITTATLIAFLLSANLAFASQEYGVQNDTVKRDNSGTVEDVTEYLKKTNLFKIEAGAIENKLKDNSDFYLFPETNKTFINKGSIWELENNGTGKLDNKGYVEEFYSLTASEVTNTGFIKHLEADGNIVNKTFIKRVFTTADPNKGIGIENEGFMNLRKNRNLKNYGAATMKSTAVTSTEKIENYGIIEIPTLAEYNSLKSANKITNKGIVLLENDNLIDIEDNSETLKDDKGRLIKNYHDVAINDTIINNGILNAYELTVDKDLSFKNNSIFNIVDSKIKENKKISFDNSTANIADVELNNGLEIEFKNNSNIGLLDISAQNRVSVKNLTIDNTTNVGAIGIYDVDVDAINLVPNEDIVNKNKVLRINNIETTASNNVNTFVSTNVDLLGNTELGNITVKDGGRLTIAFGALSGNGKINNGASTPADYYKKDIKIEGNGKIIIGVDPYDIGVIEQLGDGNNLTDSIVGQVDTTDPSLRLPQSKLNIDADSLLHDIVIGPKYSFTYTDVGTQDVRNEYKVIEATELATPIPEDEAITVPKDYKYLNDVYLSLLDAGKIKHFSVYNNKELEGLYKYLRDIYAYNPYAVTRETSFRNLSMLRDNALSDLKPNLKKWAVMGGVTHADRENNNNYEFNSTKVDTKTTGAYAKGEYGLKEDVTLGLILGGTNSKSDLATGKVKGSSMYLGAYAKKYINNFKFTLGTGMDFGEYKVDRNAVGYAGIIETSKQNAKQKNRAFDLYTELRYSKNLGNNFYLEPNFTLAYSRVKLGSVTENDGKVNLNIKSKTFNETKAELGLDLKKVLVSGNTSHNFVFGTSYERILNGAKATTVKANVVGGREFDVLVPGREKGRANLGVEYKLENKVGILFNFKVDYGFKRGNDKKDIRISTGLGYKF